MNIPKILRQSLFLQVVATLVALVLAVAALTQFLVQSTLIFSITPKVLEQHAKVTASLVSLLHGAPPGTDDLILATYSTPRRTAMLTDAFPDGARTSGLFTKPFEEEFSRRGEHFSAPDVRYRILRLRQLSSAQTGAANPVQLAFSTLEVSVAMPDGRILRTFTSTPEIFELSDLWQVIFIPIIFTIAVIILLHHSFKPLRTLESAAYTLGRTTKPIILEVKGTEDLRRLTRAFNDMQLRVQTLLADRSRMVAAIAHDIRTVLTQLKLRLENVEGNRAVQLEADVDLMERLISDMLLYARAEQPTTTPELIDLNQFLSNFASNLPTPVSTDFDPQPFWVVAESTALTRAIANICDNATAYAGAFELKTERTPEGMLIHVLDRGPGIPKEDLEYIFDPFFRGERSRNRKTGGSGLGLTIAQSLLSAQGATLTIAARDGGGTRATIFFSNATEID